MPQKAPNGKFLNLVLGSAEHGRSRSLNLLSGPVKVVALSQPPASASGPSFHYDLSRCRSQRARSALAAASGARSGPVPPALADVSGWLNALILTLTEP
ncbi:MAG: hypothetical protein L0387_19395 [Acidobacteria bacterium]|nr:hypothetical protein [Acidobacteriota bacterium]